MSNPKIWRIHDTFCDPGRKVEGIPICVDYFVNSTDSVGTKSRHPDRIGIQES